MALQPIPLGPDVLLTQGNGPYADNNTFDNVQFAGIIPMSNGVNILCFPVFNPSPPNESGLVARAFTVNGDGTQNWGNALQLTATNTGANGVAIDSTRALIVYGSGFGQMTFQVLTLNGLNLSTGASTVLTLGGGLTGFNIGPRPMKVMDPTTVLFGFIATGPSRNVVRVQLIKVVGTTVTVDFSNALNIEDTVPGLTLVELCQVDKYTCGFFWTNTFTGFQSYFGTVQLNTTYDSMTDVGFGASQLYDGTTHAMFQFRELSFGFVLAVGGHLPGSQLEAEILEFNSASHFLTPGPIVQLTQTAPIASVVSPFTFLGVATAGHQAVLLAARKPADLLQHARFLELNLGTDAREIQEIGFVDFELNTGLAQVHAPGPMVALNPRRVMMMYTPGGGGGVAIERMITVGVPLVPPLRWRQRDDCLTPGSATPCICYNLLPVNVVCVPPWWVRITSSVQFGGGVGPRNHYY